MIKQRTVIAMSESNIICIACPKGCRMTVESNNGKIINISGYSCPQGKEYAREEFLNPTRILPTTVKVNQGEFPLVSVKTEEPIPKKYLLPAMKKIAEITVDAPIKCGDVIIENILNTGVNLVATRNVNRK